MYCQGIKIRLVVFAAQLLDGLRVRDELVRSQFVSGPEHSPVAGLPAATATFAFNQRDLVGNEKSIRGCFMGSCVPVRDIPRFLRLYQEGRLPVDQLIHGYIGFDELNAGFDKLQDVKAIRQILTPDQANF